ncbi:MAG: hypothetical protein PHO26_03865 [Dehalococcoidia bacterium]|nr:hypothetical protein [Dehalococcoidia bacterium]MDD5493621.1 hypothetical protein [Dehalococcoidia bacterium]
MAAKPKKSVVQNIIKNLLEMEIPEIQNASKELADWIKQLEQHSFKLQHYATEIESWAAEEEETDTLELTELIKDLEATLTDMRKSGVVGIPELAELESDTGIDKTARGYGMSGRVLPPRTIPRAELKLSGERVPLKQIEPLKPAEDESKTEPARTPQGVLVAKDIEKPKAKAELPTGGKDLVGKSGSKETSDTEPTRGGYLTPEGFVVRKLRP